MANKLTMSSLLVLIQALEARIAELEKRNFHDDIRAKIKQDIKKSKE